MRQPLKPEKTDDIKNTLTSVNTAHNNHQKEGSSVTVRHDTWCFVVWPCKNIEAAKPSGYPATRVESKQGYP